MTNVNASEYTDEDRYFIEPTVHGCGAELPCSCNAVAGDEIGLGEVIR